MKSIVQRVTQGCVRVRGEIAGQIQHGLVVFVGVEIGDTLADAHMTARKLAGLRIFPGIGSKEPGAEERKPMDRSVWDVGGEILVISQFTLAGSVRKGRRPSFNRAEQPSRAEPLYLAVVAQLRAQGLTVATGRFGEHMEIEMVHDGPITLRIETEAGVIVS